jgi:hypothetical protein
VVRALAPTVDPRTHTALVYVDLPPTAVQAISAGMFARGEFQLGSKPALTLPQSALLLREGFAYVYRYEAGKVVQVKVSPGRRLDDRIEVSGPRCRCQGGGDRRRLPRRRRQCQPGGRRGTRQMNVSAWSIRNPIPAVLLFVMLTLSGLMAFKAMRIQQFMDIDLPTVTVTATLPGAAPAQMETEVGRKIENAVATLQGIKHIYTKIQDGTATVTVEFRIEKPTQEALDDVRDAVSRIRADLPGDLRDPVITKMNVAGAPILTYTIESARMDEEALSWFVDNNVAKILLSVRGVGAVARVGGVTREIRVELDPDRLQALRATAADVSRQLRQIPAGSLGRALRRRRHRTVGAHHRHRALRRGNRRHGDLAGRRATPAAGCAGQSQRHGGRAALGGAAQRQAGDSASRSRAAGAPAKSRWPRPCVLRSKS